MATVMGFKIRRMNDSILRAASLTAVGTTIRDSIGRAGAAVVFNGGKEHS